MLYCKRWGPAMERFLAPRFTKELRHLADWTIVRRRFLRMFQYMRQRHWWRHGPPVLCLLLLLHLDADSGLWAQTPRPLRSPSQPQRPSANPPVSAALPSTPTAQVTGISLQDGRLSVDVRDQDLRAVIESIASQGNIDIRHPEGIPNTRISMRFASLPVSKGLHRLLRAADISGYVLVTEPPGDMVRRILFLAPQEGPSTTRPASAARRVPPPQPPPPSAPPPVSPTAAPPAEAEQEEEAQIPPGTGSVFDDIKTNTTARRLLSQLVHPNEQVRERALERLVQLVGDDQKQAELLEVLEPILDDLASEDKAARDEARAELRRLLSR
jgi:hypothetical protein